MSNCIKELYDYDLVKKCYKCGIILLTSIFHKNKTKNDGLDPKCIFCRKNYSLENRNRMKDYSLGNRDRIKEYQLKNHDKIIAGKKTHSNNSYKTDNNFRLIHKTRSRIR